MAASVGRGVQLSCALALVACSSGLSGAPRDGGASAEGAADAGVRARDAAAPTRTRDASTQLSKKPDAASLDAGTREGGFDAGGDAASLDAATGPSGTMDAGRDAGVADAGREASTPDCGACSHDASADEDGGAEPPATGSKVWPQMGYDERNWYENPGETTLSVDNASSLVEKWRFTVRGFPPGTPVVGEGKVFVMATGGTYAIDLETGAEVWSRLDIIGTASAAFEPGAIYVHDSMASLWKLSSADGTTIWGPIVTYSLSGCDGTSSPVLGGDKVLVGRSCAVLEIGSGAAGAKGGVEAHRSADGSKAWSYTTVSGAEDGAMVWSSVGIDVANGTAYASSGNNYTVLGAASDAIHALDLAAGTLRWVQQVRDDDLWSLFTNPAGRDSDFGANPIVADVGGQRVVAAGDKASAFWAVNADDGQVLWQREALSPARDTVHGGILMNGAFDGTHYYAVVNTAPGNASTLYALRAADGTQAWSNGYNKYAWGAPSLANGVLVVPIDDDLHVLEAATGAALTQLNTGGTIAGGAAAIVDGKVIVGSGLQFPLDPNAKGNDQVICYGLP